MEVVSGNTLLPGDPRLIDHIVCELKSQGIFDQFRKECIADVDTKPAYQNLRQRVEGSVTGFLKQQTWRPDMNKNQLREMLRKNIHESGFLETGVERIVDQVVNPKISTVFLLQVEDVVYKFLGLEKPARNSANKTANGPLSINTIDLLPTDLDPISPDSEVLDKSLNKSDKSNEEVDKLDDSKIDDFESPPFEPITESSLFLHQDETSNDSHISGISGLTSHDSNMSEKIANVGAPDLNQQDSQLSKVSSNSRLSIITTESKHTPEKMDISDDTSKTGDGSNSKSSNSFYFNTQTSTENGFTNLTIKEEIKSELDEIKNELNDVNIKLENSEIKIETDEKSLSTSISGITDEIDFKNEEATIKVEKDIAETKIETNVIKLELEDILAEYKKSESKSDSKSERTRYDSERKRDKYSDKDKVETKIETKVIKLDLENILADYKKSVSKSDSKSERTRYDSERKRDKYSDKDKVETKIETKVIKLELEDILAEYKKSESKSDSKSERTRYDSERKRDKYSDKDKDRKSDKDRKDRDKNKSSNSSSSRDKDKYRDKSKDNKSKDSKSRDDKDKNKEYLKSREERDRKDSTRSKDDKEPKEKSKDDKEHKSRSSSSSKHSSRDHSRSKSDSKSSKESKDRSESYSRSSKDSKSKDDKSKNDEKEKLKSDESKSKDSKSSSNKSSSSNSRSRDHSKSESSKHSSRSRDRKPSSSRNYRDKKESEDPKKSNKSSKDDHSSSRDKKSDTRRSADRDSNDGSPGIGSNNSSSNKEKDSSSTSNKSKSSENSDSSQGSNSGDSGQSDSNQNDFPNDDSVQKTPVTILTANNLSNKITISSQKFANYNFDTDMMQQQVKIKKPKFASNIFEARKLMKIRKKLEKLEKKRQRQLALGQGNKQKDGDNLSIEDTDSVDSELLQNAQNIETENTKITENQSHAARDEAPQEPIQTTSAVVSKASWDAIEAKFNQAGYLNADYEHYDDDNSKSTNNDNSVKRTKKLSEDEDCLYFNSQISPTTERYLKRVENFLKNGANISKSDNSIKAPVMTPADLTMAPPESTMAPPDSTMAPPDSSKSAKRLRKSNLKNNMYNDNSEFVVTKPSVKTKNVTKGKKRKNDGQVNDIYSENNNKRIHNYDVVERADNSNNMEASASTISIGNIELKLNVKTAVRSKKKKNNAHNSSELPLALSPANEENSNEEKGTVVIPVKSRASVNKIQNQRYSSDDLYKPRPFVSGSRRQRGLLNSTDKKI